MLFFPLSFFLAFPFLGLFIGMEHFWDTKGSQFDENFCIHINDDCFLRCLVQMCVLCCYPTKNAILYGLLHMIHVFREQLLDYAS
jgi:hypothetical protein